MIAHGAGPAVNGVASSTSSDVELVLRVAAGDADALEELYNRYSHSVFGMAYSLLKDHAAAEDATQEIFLTLWSRAGGFRPERGVFRHWFLHLAHNRVIDELRRRRRVARLDAGKSPDDFEAWLPASADTADEAITTVLFGAAAEALKALPEEQRIAVVMAYIEGATQQEIANRTGAPLGTVKTRLRLGICKLRETLTGPAAVNARRREGSGA